MNPKAMRAINVKVEAALLERVDAHAERLTRQGAIPGITFGRSDSVRNLLAVALAAAEASDPSTSEPEPAKPRKAEAGRTARTLRGKA